MYIVCIINAINEYNVEYIESFIYSVIISFLVLVHFQVEDVIFSV